jgi:GxxExxY protein
MKRAINQAADQVVDQMRKDLNWITGQVVDASMKVHSALGPGLLESAYKGCLLYELRRRGLHVEFEVVLPVQYEGVQIDVGYRIDLVVEGLVIVELKSVEKLAPIHEAQLLTYLKLSGKKVGLLINFNVVHLKDGIKRMVNKLEEPTRTKDTGDSTAEDAEDRRG